MSNDKKFWEISEETRKKRQRLLVRIIVVLISLLCSAALMYVTLTYVLNINNYKSLFNFSDINWGFAFFILFFPFLFAFLFGLSQWFFLLVECRGYRFWDIIFVGFIYNLFVCISPFGFLGDIAKIYVFSKNKIKIEKIIPVIILNSFFYQLFSFVISIVALIILGSIGALQVFFNTGFASLFVFLAIIGGLIVEVCYIILLSLLIYSNKFHHLISRFFVWCLTFFRFLKTSEQQKARYQEFMASFDRIRNNFKRSFAHISLFSAALVTTLLLVLVRALIPYFAYRSISNSNNINFFAAVSAATLIEVANNLLPIPSGSGIFEIAFYNLYQYYWLLPRNQVDRIILLTRIALTFEVILVGLAFLPVVFLHVTKHTYPLNPVKKVNLIVNK